MTLFVSSRRIVRLPICTLPMKYFPAGTITSPPPATAHASSAFWKCDRVLVRAVANRAEVADVERKFRRGTRAEKRDGDKCEAK